ncbi:cell filamentation protein Fic [Piscirickettsia salmonis]|uniref:Adenosine monophosphate-protein transferase SoFic n=1 Tax=Piscirickettsia salmonis TaxID=1238 RepID=A0A9Q6PV84_PISSA|nr:Fic family protein [Piscirickettsia salmonis]RNC77864.1 DUF4172 domain-containing protein [Piscirickettsiaceae bacterium NZ-RLO2]ALA25049.1 filamentation induced by cAMP protein Fic [Piscirickettsia salmonis]APS45333.1 cell filamentation protein Fic [Piscirickettsia salmonis]APS48693.1 cell filamentation protein Fic [Piscirickettsia salmonis]APS53129.1 cell filamentation protein Fic [Piscirickettsia salmonis]
MWNWQLQEWPHFQWNHSKLQRAESLFLEGAGVITGASKHIAVEDQQLLTVELVGAEALNTSEIEGEYLNRDSVQSSVRKELGLTVNHYKASPAEAGVAEMMVKLYQNIAEPLTETMLFDWHKMLMNGRRDLDYIGSYRSHAEAMQIVSGPDYNRKIHYEAPPSQNVASEMSTFLDWFITPEKNISAITRAAIAHLWFESIHPFEDGNGRIGRAIAEKALAQGVSVPIMTMLAKVLLKRRKDYYQQLNLASRSMEVTPWLLWFATAVIEAQKNTLAYIEFIINKSKLMDQVRGQLNSRQEKALLRMFKEGPEGFQGGLSAANYIAITGASTATTTRDLQGLAEKGVLTRDGIRKATRYYLAINLNQIETITVTDIL